jgi:hypothetical protein
MCLFEVRRFSVTYRPGTVAVKGLWITEGFQTSINDGFFSSC